MALPPSSEASSSPEMGHVVEHGLLIENVAGRVHDDGAVHVILAPVGTPLHVQHKVPVGPSGDVVIEILPWKAVNFFFNQNQIYNRTTSLEGILYIIRSSPSQGGTAEDSNSQPLRPLSY